MGCIFELRPFVTTSYMTNSREIVSKIVTFFDLGKRCIAFFVDDMWSAQEHFLDMGICRWEVKHLTPNSQVYIV